ncbi:hypothetical protein MTR_1g051340 [Medicago truncatula]|uniref:Uncharacterized protein n=1 Tax=Medicago truncatula TaxID=3880 RepID=A0A072VJ83_MEDTR|nr:hypothetical protein MTR_1g051340 [Medicago truncatula]
MILATASDEVHRSPRDQPFPASRVVVELRCLRGRVHASAFHSWGLDALELYTQHVGALDHLAMGA